MPPAHQLKIYGKSYSVKKFSGDVDPKELAALVDSKMKELSRTSVKASTVDLAILTAVNLAYELLELKQKSKDEADAINKKADQLVQYLEKELNHFPPVQDSINP